MIKIVDNKEIDKSLESLPSLPFVTIDNDSGAIRIYYTAEDNKRLVYYTKITKENAVIGDLYVSYNKLMRYLNGSSHDGERIVNITINVNDIKK